jgi:uncharacterized protein YodC (DUF2158 family)
MKDKIKVGDLVKVKSGSQVMTVSLLNQGLSGFYNPSKCVCAYWKNDSYRKITVLVNSLIKVENENTVN